MGFIIKNFFLFLFLILLQSCSGGRIGNFLESSFKTVEESKIKEVTKKNLKNKLVIDSLENVEIKKNIKEPKIKEDTKKNLKNELGIDSQENLEINKNIKEPKIKEDTKKNLKNKVVVNSDEKLKKNKKVIKKKIPLLKRKYKPQSYKIIFILKDVDPTDPIEDLSSILRDSNVNFEIEKIERFFDSKDRDIKRD